MRGALLALGLLALAAPAGALEQPLADPAKEARAQALAAEIRCVVCESEPVSRSDAEMAVDMRRVIRERLAAGDTDAQVLEYFAARYGEFVLLRPRLNASTVALWATPLVLLAAAGAGLFFAARRRPTPAPGDEAAAAAGLALLERPTPPSERG